MITLFRSFIALTVVVYSTTVYAEPISINLDIDEPNWQSLEYSKIPANQLEKIDKGLRIRVNGSASPLIYVFDEITLLSNIDIKGALSELPKIPVGKHQGEPGADDFAFRLGLVITGEKKLNFAQKLIAADWVKTLYNLAPKGTGIDHVKFLNMANTPAPEWKTRSHPQSKGLFEELIVAESPSAGSFHMSYQLEKPIPVVAFWISSDGDDTGSKYEVDIHQLTYSKES